MNAELDGLLNIVFIGMTSQDQHQHTWKAHHQ
jgi:hypothetical protein